MASQENEKMGCERLGKLLFVKLDPTLRSLLAVLQEHQEIVENTSGEARDIENGPIIIGATVPRKLEREERILGLLRAEIDLLKNVQQTLHDFPESPLVTEEHNLAGALTILMDYISLPVVAILRRPLAESLYQINEEGEDGIRRRLHIRQAAERKSITVAAQTLRICFELLDERDNNGLPSSMTISRPKLLQLVLACSSALPTGREIAEKSTSTFLNNGLDRGESHIESLLHTLLHLLQQGDSNPSESEGFGSDLAGAMDGALLAHLADVCVSAVASPLVFSESLCLMAMETFEKLLAVVPTVSVWRHLFPGCFAGMFRTVAGGLRGGASTPQAKTNVIQSSLRAFTGLLRLTVGGAASSTEEKLTKRTLADLQRIIARSEGGATNQGSDPRKILGDSSIPNQNEQSKTAEDQMDPNESFLSEINVRLPGPLTALVKLARTAQSPVIRREAVDLCQVILIETRPSWEKDVLQDLTILSLESCLILSRDDDETVVTSAQSVLEEYNRTASSKNDMSPRLLSMIEELPALAQRHSEVELINQLKLISAFLALNNSSGVHPRKRKTCKTLQSTLAAEGVFLDLRRAIAKLFDVDLSFPSPGQTPSIEVLDQGSLLLDSKPYNYGNQVFRYIFLTSASEKEACSVIHELGRSLGPKHAAILVDGIVADLFNDCIGRVESGISRTGRSQEAWCHEWIGCLELARELLNGAFTSVDDKGKVKVVKKVKYLTSLATSILPILSSSPLWDLPLNVTHLLVRERDWSNSRALISSSDTFSPMALRGNACFMCRLFQIIEAIFGLLQRDSIGLVPSVLPPLLQKATTTNVECVKESALATLSSIASSSGFDALGNMIWQNMSVVAGSILATLRFPGGRSSFPVEDGPNEMFEVARTLRSVLELALNGSDQHHKRNESAALPCLDKSSLSYVIELVVTLTERYDCLASKNRFDFDTTLAMVNVYEPAFCFLRFVYRAEEFEAWQSSERKLSSEPQPWLEQLSSFRKLEADAEITSGDMAAASVREGFEACHNNKRDDQSVGMPAKDEQSARLVSNQEIVFVSMLLSRCTFWLSNSGLRLQLESCNAMACGFQFLAVVALICKDPDDSSRTAIRRQVNDSWPPIEARLVSLTNGIQVSRVSSIVVARQVGMPAAMQEMDVSTKKVFLSKLFNLVTIMAQCSEDFIASRFKNDVFPLLSKLLADSGSYRDLPPFENLDDTKIVSIRDSTQPKTSSRQASETSLIVSMLRCLAGVFGQRKCGQALLDLIPAAGNLVFPFLGESSEAGTACIQAIKKMVLIDCDALWRPLVQLSERDFPPAKPWESSTTSASKEINSEPTIRLAERAMDLVAFIETLPEQPLF